MFRSFQVILYKSDYIEEYIGMRLGMFEYIEYFEILF